MAKVDAVRFLDNLQKFFAPAIFEGQEFTAYIDWQSNELLVQAENILNVSSNNVDTEFIQQLLNEANRIFRQFSSIQSQVDALENLCRNIPALRAQIETLHGEIEDGLINFTWASIQDELFELKLYINKLVEAQNEGISADERILVLEDRFNTLQEVVDDLSSTQQVISETEFDVSNL